MPAVANLTMSMRSRYGVLPSSISASFWVGGSLARPGRPRWRVRGRLGYTAAKISGWRKAKVLEPHAPIEPPPA